MFTQKKSQEPDEKFAKDPNLFSSLVKKIQKKMKVAFWGIGILVVLGSVVTAWHFQKKYTELLHIQQNPQSELSSVLSKISSLMDLPLDETPTLATITDSTRLSGQMFFDHAENGDKVIVYTKAAKAILFRPSSRKIINVSSVVDDTRSGESVKSGAKESPSEPTKAAVSPAPLDTSEVVLLNQKAALGEKARVALYNGTKTVGLTTDFERGFFADATNVLIVAKMNAVGTDYGNTMVIDLTSSQTTLARQIATKLGASLSPIPNGEKIPDADILIILGQDQLNTY